MIAPLLLILSGCGSTTLDSFEACTIDLSLDSESAAPGEIVIARGGPQFSAFDTTIRISGTPATVVDVDRSAGCTSCEACRAEFGCLPCGFCPPCDDACQPVIDAEGNAVSGCVETASFEVPDLPAGPAQVVVVNRFGTSDAIDLEIRSGTDTGTTDTSTSSPTETADTGT